MKIIKEEDAFNFIESIERTLTLLRKNNLDECWENKESLFWNQHYENADNIENNDWGERLYQREYMLEHIPEHPSCTTILDIGCGEGQNFINIFSHSLANRDTLYIAVDVSISALQTNKKHNKHPNKIFILGSASSVPIKAESISHILLFGVLHHTELKDQLLKKIIHILIKNGVALLVEPVVGTKEYQRLLIDKIKLEGKSSPYEERIVESDLISAMSFNYKVIYLFNYHWALYNFFLKRFAMISKNKRLHNFILFVDSFIGSTLRYMPQRFRSHEVMAVLVKKESSNQTV